MKSVGSFYRSSIGRKFLMAVTGLVLIGFVIGHLVGNLQIFSAPDKINGYAEFLHSTGATLWTVRILLIVCTIVHVWAAISLTRDNQRARGGPRYTVKHTIRATLASRTMRLTGFVVLAFVVYHLLHFTIGGVDANFKENLPRYVLESDYHILGVKVVDANTPVLDVHTMMVKGFQNPIVSIFYVIAVGLLSYHIVHGLDSMFQTLGLRNTSWSSGLRKFSVLFATLYFLGNAAIPVSILAGAVKQHPPSAAQAVTATLHTNSVAR
ncbi:MAG TPA: succinate dehydrogenase cytochrome b subunit [Opitutaceae bacterium]|nr:succinate dehydrogenase cytochrome b subunit [Opitutaceae bacterium]